jgi:hypothetical protein
MHDIVNTSVQYCGLLADADLKVTIITYTCT